MNTNNNNDDWFNELVSQLPDEWLNTMGIGADVEEEEPEEERLILNVIRNGQVYYDVLQHIDNLRYNK